MSGSQNVWRGFGTWSRPVFLFRLDIEYYVPDVVEWTSGRCFERKLNRLNSDSLFDMSDISQLFHISFVFKNKPNFDLLMDPSLMVTFIFDSNIKAIIKSGQCNYFCKYWLKFVNISHIKLVAPSSKGFY